MFITIEDETGPANLVVWPTLFEKRRRVVLGSSMMAINGRIQREGEVVHLVAQQLFDLSGDLVGMAGRDEEFKLPTGRGDEFAHSGGPDPRDKPKSVVAPRDMFVPLCRVRHKGALVRGSRLERMPVFDGAVYAVAPLRRTDFGRAHSSMRLRTVQPIATSVC